jgi:hypothetical protein
MEGPAVLPHPPAQNDCWNATLLYQRMLRAREVSIRQSEVPQGRLEVAQDGVRRTESWVVFTEHCSPVGTTENNPG